MVRYSVVMAAFLATAVWASATPAEALFDEISRDFGAVPRGPILAHPFRLVNTTSQVMVIHNVRVSCGCVTARALQTTLRPGDETAIVVNMDTRRFVGYKSVVVFVTFVQPRFEEVRLTVQANSRDDVVFTPERLDLGRVKRGASPTGHVTVSFIGSNPLHVTEVRCESNYLQPACQLVRQENGELTYQLSATLRSDTPVGKWFTDVWLQTNNPTVPRIRVPLAVEVEPPLSATPKLIDLGAVKLGTASEHRVVIRAGQPFRVTGIAGSDAQLQVRDVSPESQKVHVLTVTLRPSSLGELRRTIRVHTDLKQSGEIEFNTQALVTR